MSAVCLAHVCLIDKSKAWPASASDKLSQNSPLAGDNGSEQVNVVRHLWSPESAFELPGHTQEAFMRLFAIICSIAILSLAIPAFAEGDAGAGKEVFSKKCASCHGTAGEGKDTVAKALKVELRHLGAKEVQTKSDADLKKNILEGVGKMRAVAGVDAKAADDLVAYLRTLKKK